jgi:hypothetical protein
MWLVNFKLRISNLKPDWTCFLRRSATIYFTARHQGLRALPPKHRFDGEVLVRGKVPSLFSETPIEQHRKSLDVSPGIFSTE